MTIVTENYLKPAAAAEATTRVFINSGLCFPKYKQ